MTLDAWASSRADRCPGCGHHVATQGCHCAGSEWAVFVRALRKAADASPDGRVHQHLVRPLIRDRMEPKAIGRAYSKARRERLLVEVGREPSRDERGRNTNKWDPYYELRGAA